MNYEQLIASYPDEPRKHAANSGWNAANTAMFNAILDESTKAGEAGNYAKAATLVMLTEALQNALALKRV
jgi:hypothetical protein